MPETNVEPEQKTDSKQEVVLDEETKSGLATAYKSYRTADLRVSTKFADVCDYVILHKVDRRNLINVLIDNVKLSKDSAKVEATYILGVCKEANAPVLKALKEGKITVSEARTQSSTKAIQAREAKETEEKAKAEAAAAGVEYVPPPKPEAGTGTKTPGKPPMPFEDRLGNDLSALIGRVLDQDDPKINEEWFVALTHSLFEQLRAKRQAEAVKKAGEAEAAAKAQAEADKAKAEQTEQPQVAAA